MITNNLRLKQSRSVDNLILRLDTGCVKTKRQQPEPKKLWQKTPFANLVRYQPSGAYFARVRVQGKLIRKSLKTDVLSVAKLRLADFERTERGFAEKQTNVAHGRMTFGDAMELYRQQTEASPLLKPSAKHYRAEVMVAIVKSWPGIKNRDVRKISEHDCKTWASAFGAEYSPTRYNAAIGVLRAILALAIESGAVYSNPAAAIKRAKVLPKRLELPNLELFDRFVKAISDCNGRYSRDCANLVRFLAYGGFRLGEAANVTWQDCDFAKGKIVLRGDPVTGTKNNEVREVPMIPDMRALLERLSAVHHGRQPTDHVMRVKEAGIAMTRAAKLVGMRRITHHDLRHLFATRCIEAGVDIPTVSRWLGHKDGGALAMKTYGHLRDEHSVNMAKRVSFSNRLANRASSPTNEPKGLA